jgi:hypothetical protein
MFDRRAHGGPLGAPIFDERGMRAVRVLSGAVFFI